MISHSVVSVFEFIALHIIRFGEGEIRFAISRIVENHGEGNSIACKSIVSCGGVEVRDVLSLLCEGTDYEEDEDET